MSELIDLAFPNLLTASELELPPEDTGALLLGLQKRGYEQSHVTSKAKIIYFVSKSLSQFEDFDVDSLERFSLRSCSQAGLLLFIPDEGAHMSSILDLELPQPASSFSTTSKSSKKLSFVLV